MVYDNLWIPSSRQRWQGGRVDRTACGILTVCSLLMGIWGQGGLLCAMDATTMKIGGVGAALGTMTRLVQAWRTSQPQIAITLVANLDSTGSLQALAAGAIQLAIPSRPLTEDESARGLVTRYYGTTPFVLTTTKAGIEGLTLSQIAEIYAGRQSTWPDGSPIRLVLRPLYDMDSRLLQAFSPDIEAALARAVAREGMIIADTDQEAADRLEALPGALGCSTLALLLAEQRALRPLAIDGIMPSVATIANGSYPYVKHLYLATQGAPQGATARFIEFVFSPTGQAILAATGHWVDDRLLSHEAKEVK